MKDGHRVPYRDHLVGPTAEVLLEDPCPLDLPETLTMAHIAA